MWIYIYMGLNDLNLDKIFNKDSEICMEFDCGIKI